ncbi:MAG: hypothetical protein HUJ25_02010 [Crocinitomicaceae bacterium]|nr:hypothetical protein [Crocinitomicaceae bacterium]
MKYSFQNLKNDKIKKLFLEVLRDFPTLHEHEIILSRSKLKSSTMRAQPLITIRNFFASHKKYKVTLGFHIRDKEELIIAKVPDDALKGWFAHELAHVVDYRQYSSFHLIAYGIRYVFSASFRKKVEHDADYIAIKYGFTDEILATKRYILEHELIEDKYKKKIKRYYLSVDQVHLCSEDRSLLEPYIHL